MLTLNQLFGAREHDAGLRAYAVYRTNHPEPCPTCGGRHWRIGRVSAECATCATALPLVDAGSTGDGLIRGTLRSAGPGVKAA
jgi:hypothetical protein